MMHNFKKINFNLHTIIRRGYSKLVDVKINDIIHGFKVRELREIKDLNLTATYLEHENTGAQHLHINKKDKNNVFSIGFKTIPNSSNGVAHILEHTTLCGSEKYPIRDPFFKMLNRSLATYMNAWTAHDFTNYPFATMNEKDYYNLMNIYLDATLFPKLNKMDFFQEGWRLEKEDINDINSPWKIKGVVYNEMKGAISDINSLFYYKHQEQFYNGTTYQYNSGGDPSDIPNLSYEELKAFHLKNYSPQQCKTFSYGDMDMSKHLEVLNQTFLKVLNERKELKLNKNEDKINKNSLQWSENKKVIVDGPYDPMCESDKQHKISITYLTNNKKDILETISLSLLSNLLLNGASAPMHQALLDSNLGAEYSATTGYNNHIKMTNFSVGLQGVMEKDLEKVEETIYNVLKEVAKNGFTSKQIEAALVPIELAYKHRTANFGIGLVQGLYSNWMDDNNPIDGMEINKILNQLRENIKKGKYFENLIEKYMINNQHKMVFIMQPSNEYNNLQEEKEKQILNSKVKQMINNDKDIELLYKNSIHLNNLQNQKEDLSCLPTLSLNQIQKEPNYFNLTNLNNPNHNFRFTDTNGISYMKFKLMVNNLPKDLSNLLPLFCECLTYLGTLKKSMSELELDIKLNSGGINFSPLIVRDLNNIQNYEEGILISFNGLDTKLDSIYSLMNELLLNSNFDDLKRLRTLIKLSASSMSNSIADSGHSYAKTYSNGQISLPSYVNELHSGLTQIRFLNDLCKIEDLSPVASNLKEIANILYHQNHASTLIITQNGQESVHQPLLNQFISQLKEGSIGNHNNLKLDNNSNLSTWFQFPFNSNYSSLSMNCEPYSNENNPKYQVLSSLLTNLYLHKEVREKGGAYGGGANFSSINGHFNFYSYRDPKPLTNVLNTFKNSLEWATNYQFSNRELDEAKLSIFQSLDKPVSAGEEGTTQFFYDVSKESLQSRRNTLLSCNANEIQQLAFKLLNKTELATTILGDSNGLDINGFRLIK